MLYEVITASNLRECYLDLVRQGRQNEIPLFRITSYNVCYTKLLRFPSRINQIHGLAWNRGGGITKMDHVKPLARQRFELFELNPGAVEMQRVDHQAEVRAVDLANHSNGLSEVRNTGPSDELEIDGELV